ncbi:MAG: energy-coupled thiamine transporter ThiT [Theionarchaea archaeon]|nr:energy-coupled thiamine transporter ThiT [Theionarchaea archaeon]
MKEVNILLILGAFYVLFKALDIPYALLGVIVGIAGRFLCHFISGVIFFSEYAPEGMNPWIYSALYNGSYILGELIISVILIYLLIKKGVLDIFR